MTDFALYIHVPFCVRKCAYCDFVSYPNRERQWRAYFQALEEEMRAWRDKMQGRPCASVFFGGGTPSLMPAELLTGALSCAATCFSLRTDAEITLEANPGTVDAEKLRCLRRAGFNRISFGVQAMDDGLLRKLGRVHTAAEVVRAVADARKAGFDNLNLDVMYALPEQTPEMWRETLERVLAFHPEHVSAYSLILEEGTQMAAMASQGEIRLPGEEEVLAMQRAAGEMLAAAGRIRYEISNYALPGRECRHNLTYWYRGEYLGIGCAAHSLMDETRFHNAENLEEYLSGGRRLDVEQLDAAARAEELILLSTRTVKGLSLEQFRRETGEELTKYAPCAWDFVRTGFATMEDGRFALTPKGMEVQNAIVTQMVR